MIIKLNRWNSNTTTHNRVMFRIKSNSCTKKKELGPTKKNLNKQKYKAQFQIMVYLLIHFQTIY